MKHELCRDKRAVMYIRVANVRDGSTRAVTAQREACERIANGYGVHVVREYADLGKPARWEQQPELQRLLVELAEQRDVAYVVIFDYARLARDLASLDGIIRRIHLCGAEIATTTGVATAHRLTTSRELDRVAEWAQTAEPTPPYPLELLRAAYRGLTPTQQLIVTALLPNGDTVHGRVAGVGLRIGIQPIDGLLVEDVQADWVVTAQVQDTNERRNS
jgi:hypothetical protein